MKTTPTKLEISKDSIDILINGMGINFNKAEQLINNLYDHPKIPIYLLSSNNERHIMGRFGFDSNLYLYGENGSNLRIPIKRFVFDTSAIGSKVLLFFLDNIGQGEYFYPHFIRNEVHMLDEKLKKNGMPNPIQKNLKY